MQPLSPTPAQTKVLALLRAADRDTEMAESLAQHAPHLYEGIGFSCQQAAEKYLKAALIAHNLPAPYIHDLTSLATKSGNRFDGLDCFRPSRCISRHYPQRFHGEIALRK